MNQSDIDNVINEINDIQSSFQKLNTSKGQTSKYTSEDCPLISIATNSLIGDVTSFALHLAVGIPSDKQVISSLQEEVKSLKLLVDKKTVDLEKTSSDKNGLQSQVLPTPYIYSHCFYYSYYY